MQNLFDRLTQAFRKNRGELSYEQFDNLTKEYSPFKEERDTLYLLLQSFGYPIEESLIGYRLSTYFTPWQDGRYCIIDIETNGSKPGYSQVIEIGAVMYQRGKIVDKLESFVQCSYLPYHISELTGIMPDDLIGAPDRKEALRSLREFLGDAIFVAHNAKFDYTFLNASFQRFGLGPIGNQTICTIELAKRTFESQKYGLAYLNETLNLGLQSHHRAYSDALATSKIFQKSLNNIPNFVKSSDDLVRFAKMSTKEINKLKKKGRLTL